MSRQNLFLARARTASWDMPADAGFLCAKSAELVDTIEETPCSSPRNVRFSHSVHIKIVILYPKDGGEKVLRSVRTVCYPPRRPP
jgi:hypothetical protein